jgi:hypothetical protein
MNADQFATALSQTAPSDEELRVRGYSDDLIDMVRLWFQCVPRPNPGPHLSDPLLDLLTCYDCSKAEVGGFQFASHPSDLGDGWLVGTDDSDEVVINKSDGEIEILELGADHVMCRCAHSSSQFLDALVLCAKALEFLAANDPRHVDQLRRHSFAEECTRLAGGPEFSSYDLTMLGCE